MLSQRIEELKEWTNKLTPEQVKFIEITFFNSDNLQSLIKENYNDPSFLQQLNLINQNMELPFIWDKVAFLTNVSGQLENCELNENHEKNQKLKKSAQQFLKYVLFIVLNHQTLSDNYKKTTLDEITANKNYIAAHLIDNADKDFVFDPVDSYGVLDCFHDVQKSYKIALELQILPEYFCYMTKTAGCIDARSKALLSWTLKQKSEANPSLGELIEGLIEKQVARGIRDEEKIFLAIIDQMKQKALFFEVEPKSTYPAGQLTPELLAHYLQHICYYDNPTVKKFADQYDPKKIKQPTVNKPIIYDGIEDGPPQQLPVLTKTILMPNGSADPEGGSEIENVIDSQKKSAWLRFKTFLANHWGKILVGTLVGALLVVAGVFTAGLVPMIAAGLGVSIAAAAGIGFGGAAVIGGLAGAGAGAIAGAVPTKQEHGVKSFLSRHKWKILAAALLLTFIVGCVLTGGILAAFGIVAAGGAVGAGLAFCGGITAGISGGVAASAGAAGVAISATAATAIGTTVVTAGVATLGTSTGLVLGAIADNKKEKKADPEIKIVPIVLDSNRSPTKFFDKIKRILTLSSEPTQGNKIEPK